MNGFAPNCAFKKSALYPHQDLGDIILKNNSAQCFPGQPFDGLELMKLGILLSSLGNLSFSLYVEQLQNEWTIRI